MGWGGRGGKTEGKARPLGRLRGPPRAPSRPKTTTVRIQDALLLTRLTPYQWPDISKDLVADVFPEG